MTLHSLTRLVAATSLGISLLAAPARQTPVQSPPAQQTPPPTTPPPTPPPPTTPPTTAPQDPNLPPFEDWVTALRAEARTKGISDATLDAALTGVQPDPVIIARDRAQPELTQSLDEYVTARLSTKTLTAAADASTKHRALLAKVEATYGVSAPVMVAIWALESNFGQFTGTRPTVAALATLAYDSRRPVLFRGELFEALRIIDKGLVTAADLKGSWAGAIGQPQFMPSSFLRHAVDFDGDGRIDIWTSEADVLGSMAKYLNAAGWVKGERWGREVEISASVMDAIDQQVPMRTAGCRSVREMTKPQPLATWKALGVKLPAGFPLPNVKMDASLVRGVHRDFLVYRNYDALLGYNCSNSYAIAAGLMSDAIAARKTSVTPK